MSCLLLLLVLSGTPESDGDSNVESPRRFHEINRDMRDLIRRHARAESDAESAESTRRMCRLYLEIKHDSRLASSRTLKTYQAKLWSKLKQIEADLERQFAQDKRLGRKRPALSPEEWASPGAKMAREASGSLAGTYSLVGSSLGGPGQLFAHGGSFGGGSFGGGSFGGGAGPADLGPALVELIQRTIAPDFWDVVGGPGTIVYFAPLRVIVVRATTDVHHRIGGAVGGLRRAGQ